MGGTDETIDWLLHSNGQQDYPYKMKGPDTEIQWNDHSHKTENISCGQPIMDEDDYVQVKNTEML